MVPYYAFLCVFILLMLLGCFERVPIKRLLLGGMGLAGTPVAFAWFVSCLFTTQITAFFIAKLNNHKILICAMLSYFTAMMLQWYLSSFDFGYEVVFFVLPLSIEVVPMALTFYLIGFLGKTKFLSSAYSSYKFLYFSVFIIFIIVFFDYKGIQLPSYAMPSQRYALPGINIIVPVTCFVLTGYCAVFISRWYYLNKILTAIGRAAIPILFTHLILPIVFIKNLNSITGLNIDCFISRVALGLLLPYILYCLLNQFYVTRKIFLGM